MNIKPGSIGKRPIWEIGGQNSYTGAQLLAMDGPWGDANGHSLWPVAYTATLDERSDGRVYRVNNNSTYTFPASMAISWGLFLTPDDVLKSLLFWCSGGVNYFISGADHYVVGGFFFFGRLNAATVPVVDLAAPQNQTEPFNYIILPMASYQNQEVAGGVNVTMTCDTSPLAVVDPEVDYTTPWVFGFALANPTAVSTTILSSMKLDLHFFKYSDEQDAFSPSGY